MKRVESRGFESFSCLEFEKKLMKVYCRFSLKPY